MSTGPKYKPGPAGVMQALLFLVGGLVAGFYIISTDRALRGQTLHEVMLEGSKGAVVGDPAPLREVVFEVENLEVEHSLMLAPRAEALDPPQGAVELSFTLTGPEGQVLVEDASFYDVRSNSRRTRRSWESKTFPFRPQQLGTHTLNLVILTSGIPEVHVRVADPLKTDGERIPGF